MAIIGRKIETNIINKLLNRQGPQFLAVYGRRRIGKTYLIRESYKKYIKYECTGLHNASQSEQLENFWIQLTRVYKKPVFPPTTWLGAFDLLGKYLDGLPQSQKKKVIFLDEISWYDTARSGFMPAFTNFWNSYCSKRDDMLLVICGSAASWILDKVVNDTGGLHNRLTRTLRLAPFTLSETKDYLRSKRINLSDKDIAQVYMCIGGIPYYLNEIEPGYSIPQILDHLFFNSQASLSSEFDNLYASLFKNHEKHLTVIKALSKKNKGLTRKEIIAATKLKSGGGLTTILEELEECGFIIKTFDFDKQVEDGLYRLMDEYSIFYYKFIQNKRSRPTGISVYASQSFKIWSGIAFENLCIRHEEEIASALGIQGISRDIYSFIDKGTNESTGAQIDIVLERADNSVTIIEAKFYDGLYKMTKAQADNITNKVNSFRRKTKTTKNIYVTLITSAGAERNKHFLSVVSNEVELKELF